MLNRVKSIKLNKSAAVLLVAVVLGLIAAFVAKSYMSNRIEEIESGLKGKMTEVIVAKSDLERGAVLSPDSVAVRQIPIEYAHEQAVTPSSYDAAAGEKLSFDVKAGQMILWPMLEEKKAPSFSHRVEVGRRAMTVPVDEISSISGMLEPGDMIDLMATVDRDGRKITVPLLQYVQVLATGQRSIDDPKSGERREYSTVTLDTTPQQAQQVIAAREEGRITALLRNPDDKDVLPVDAMNLNAALTSESKSGASVPAQSKQIPVLYGGSTEKFRPEDLSMGSAKKIFEILNASGGSVSAAPAANAGPTTPKDIK